MAEQKDLPEITITFNASGYVRQTVQITNPKFTPEQVVQMLNDGSAVTTVQEGGTLDITATGEKIGEVVNVDNDLEYEEFDLDS